MEQTKKDLLTTLHANNPIMDSLQTLWDESYSHQRLVSFEDLVNAPFPMIPHDFERFIQDRVRQMSETLMLQYVWTNRSIYRLKTSSFLSQMAR